MPDTRTPGQVFAAALRQAWQTDPTFVVCAAVAIVGMSLVTCVAVLALLVRLVELWKGCPS
jgi:hypothetical protein